MPHKSTEIYENFIGLFKLQLNRKIFCWQNLIYLISRKLFSKDSVRKAIGRSMFSLTAKSTLVDIRRSMFSLTAKNTLFDVIQLHQLVDVTYELMTTSVSVCDLGRTRQTILDANTVYVAQSETLWFG